MCAVSANRSEGDKKLKELHGILSFGISKFWDGELFICDILDFCLLFWVVFVIMFHDRFVF
jgi:hypothetical protein